VLLVFGDLPGVEAEDMARAKCRTAIGVKEAVLRFVEHRPYFQPRSDTPTKTVQHALFTTGFASRPPLLRLFGQRLVGSFVGDVESDRVERFAHIPAYVPAHVPRGCFDLKVSSCEELSSSPSRWERHIGGRRGHCERGRAWEADCF